MPTTKTGQTSHLAVTSMQQEHYDLQNRIAEILATVDLDVKRKIISRLPAFIDEIKSEMSCGDMGGMDASAT